MGRRGATGAKNVVRVSHVPGALPMPLVQVAIEILRVQGVGVPGSFRELRPGRPAVAPLPLALVLRAGTRPWRSRTCRAATATIPAGTQRASSSWTDCVSAAAMPSWRQTPADVETGCSTAAPDELPPEPKARWGSRVTMSASPRVMKRLPTMRPSGAGTWARAASCRALVAMMVASRDNAPSSPSVPSSLSLSRAPAPSLAVAEGLEGERSARKPPCPSVRASTATGSGSGRR